jgi:hypothetical protein
LESDAVGEVSKQIQRVTVGSFADDRRRPKSGPDLDHDEDPDLLLFASDDCSDLIGLKFCSRESLYFSITKPATAGSGSFQPTMNCIPSDSLDSSDGGLVEAFHTESGNFIKRGATVVKSIIRRPDCRTECLSTSLTLVATTISPPSLVKAMANDGSAAAVFRGRAVRIGTSETLHGCWTL